MIDTAGGERLELALRAARMGTWDWDLRTDSVTWSRELEEIHGFRPGAFGTGLDTYFSHLHPQDADRVRSCIHASLLSGELEVEYRGITPAGEERWYEARGQLARDSSGQPVALRGVCIDITERRRAEQALRESEERFRTLADSIAPFAWMADGGGRIFWFSQRWHEYTGTWLSEMQGTGWTKVHHPQHVQRVVTGLKRACESGELWEDTFPLRGRDGRYRWFLSRAVPIRDEHGIIVRWLGTDTDITERRWSEALLEGERNALEMIALGMPAATVLGQLCRTVEELADDGLVASILLLDPDGLHLRHGAAPSLPDSYNRAIDGIAIGPSVGSCGTAAYLAEQVIVSDIATDPLWAEYRELALTHGLRACWSTPIKSLHGAVLGTFALYYHRASMPTSEHLRLAALVGRTAAIIIERKRADETRARLLAIVDSSDDEITGKTLEGIVTSWNPAATRLYGYTAEERIGRSITEIIPPEQLEEHSAIMQRIAHGERVPAWDTARLHKDGHRVEISLSLSPILDDAGEVIGVSAIGRDAGERRRLDSERRQVEETLRQQSALLQLAPAAVTVRDAERRIEYWNPAAETLYGWTSSEACGQLSYELLATRFPMALAEHEAILQQEGAWEGEVVRRRRDGQEVVVWSRWLVLTDARGRQQTLEVSTDITEQKEAEAVRARLYEAEKAAHAAAESAINARDEFIAVVSHDLRNPLAAVKGHVQLMRRRAARGDVPTAEQLIQQLDVIQSSIGALSSQIDELHDATQLHPGRKLELRTAPTDFVSLVRECVERHQHASDSHQLRFETDIPELIGTWDAPRMERVLANLLSNAIKYSPNGGEVLVHVSREPEWAVVSVADQGLGIPAADLPHIFERFRRASNVGAQIAGSGIGLAGARDIVEQHGGVISVQSHEGEGSTFRIRLPLRAADSPGGPESALSERSSA